MKILDWYILKRYLFTFFMMLLLFIPIGITVHLAEKIGKILENDVPLNEVLVYFLDFTIYFAHLLFPLFLFLSVIWFTSKLANNTEVIAFLSSGVSFTRFLRPYMIGATIVAFLSIILGLFLAPKASEGFNDFSYKYFKKHKSAVDDKNVFRQINDNEIIYVSRFNKGVGNNFSLEHFEGNELKHKITASSIKFIEKDTTYRLTGYVKRIIGENDDQLEILRRKDTLFDFKVKDLLYRKWSLPVSVFILTIIAVAVSSKKRRGGMGVNLAIGICIAMIFVFFDKIFGVMAEQSDFNPIIAVWFPNIIFGILAAYMLYHAKR